MLQEYKDWKPHNVAGVYCMKSQVNYGQVAKDILTLTKQKDDDKGLIAILNKNGGLTILEKDQPEFDVEVKCSYGKVTMEAIVSSAAYFLKKTYKDRDVHLVTIDEAIDGYEVVDFHSSVEPF